MTSLKYDFTRANSSLEKKGVQGRKDNKLHDNAFSDHRYDHFQQFQTMCAAQISVFLFGEIA